MKRAGVAAVVLIVAVSPRLFPQRRDETRPNCEAPEYFGICDPFVPGINLSSDEESGFRVGSAWPNGPADSAGVCPGDEVVAVADVPTASRDLAEVLKGLVSEEPSPVDLKIKRGDRTLDFHLPRVRESTLAALSKQKWVFVPFFPSGRRLVTVPLDESQAEIEAFREVELHAGQSCGFKLAGDVWVPQGTPDEQLRLLAETRAAGTWPQRFVSAVILIGPAYGAGFSALLLRKPEQVLVDKVLPRSPAYRAGLLTGDELVEVDGHPVSGLNQNQLADLILEPGDRAREVALGVQRGASLTKFELKTQRTQEFASFLSMFGAIRPRGKRPPGYLFGLQTFDADDPRRVIVTGVDYPSPAFTAGLHVGDEVMAADEKPIEQITREQLSQLLEPSGPSELSLEVLRLGKMLNFRFAALTEAQAQAGIGRKMTEKGPGSPLCAPAPAPSEAPK